MKKTFLTSAIIASCLLVDSFFPSSSVSGQNNIEAQTSSKKLNLLYNPPPQRKKPKLTQRNGSGSRSSCLTSNLPQVLIAPAFHTGQTTQSHPSFSVYFPEVPQLPVSVSVEDPKNQKDVWLSEISVKKAGITTFRLPSYVSGLEIGKEYIWTVALICSRRNRLQDIYAEASIERIEISEKLKQKLSTAPNPQSLAEILASEGLFYDTLNQINKISTTTERNALLDSLLEQINLVGVVSIK